MRMCSSSRRYWSITGCCTASPRSTPTPASSTGTGGSGFHPTTISTSPPMAATSAPQTCARYARCRFRYQGGFRPVAPAFTFRLAGSDHGQAHGPVTGPVHLHRRWNPRLVRSSDPRGPGRSDAEEGLPSMGARLQEPGAYKGRDPRVVRWRGARDCSIRLGQEGPRQWQSRRRR